MDITIGNVAGPSGQQAEQSITEMTLPSTGARVPTDAKKPDSVDGSNRDAVQGCLPISRKDGFPNIKGTTTSCDEGANRTPSIDSSNISTRQGRSCEEKPYQCQHCSQAFDSNEEPTNHTYLQNGGKPGICDIPEKSSGLECDSRSHKQMRSSVCHICHCCSKVFDAKDSFMAHVEAHEAEVKSCQFCNRTFESSEELKAHTTANKTSDLSQQCSFQCSYCGKLFRTMSSVIEHERIHTGSRPFVCSTCGAAFRTKNRYAVHFAMRHSARRYRLKCDVCSKGFYDKKALKYHYVRHTGKRPYKCEFCDKDYPHRVSLKRHKQRTHFKKSLLTCTGCGEDLFTKKEVRNHGEGHCTATQGPKPSRFICEFCGKGFHSLSDMTRHQRCHTGEKPYKCDFCERWFSDLRNRKIHHRVHTGERPYNCKYCNRAFSRSTSAKSHERIRHEKPKPKFKCLHCGKVYKIKTAYENHVKGHSVVREKKRFPCQLCGKDYVSLWALQRHERCHSGDMPYQCQLCNRSFVRKDYRDEHQIKACPLKTSDPGQG